MKVLFSAENFYPFIGGAELSMYTLLSRLAKKHEVHSFFLGKENLNFEMGGIHLHQRKVSGRLNRHIFPYAHDIYLNNIWKIKLKKEILSLVPDLILTQLRLSPSVVDIAYQKKIPVVLFIRSYEFFCLTDFVFENCDKNCWNCLPWLNKNWNFSKLDYPFFKIMFEWHRKSMKSASLIISNSKYTRTMVERWFNINSEVLYPSIDLDEYKVNSREARYITLLKPYKPCGVDIFIEIAKKMKREEFLVCGDVPLNVLKRIKPLGNVTYVPYSKSIRNIYSQTRLLVLPTIRPEPFGRAIVEAMVNGIPCIVSNRGGLPEAVGGGGDKIEKIYNIKKWINVIKKYDNEDYYSKVSEKAKIQATKFEFRHNFKRFEETIEKKLFIGL